MPAPDTGYFIGPVIFSEVSPTATIAQEEIFGPVVAVLVKDLPRSDRLLTTNYALTGGLTPGRQPIFRWHKSSLK